MSKVVICPVCGFSFKFSERKTEYSKIKCPMCGHEFKVPNVTPFNPKEFNKKIREI